MKGSDALAQIRAALGTVVEPLSDAEVQSVTIRWTPAQGAHVDVQAEVSD